MGKTNTYEQIAGDAAPLIAATLMDTIIRPLSVQVTYVIDERYPLDATIYLLLL